MPPQRTTSGKGLEHPYIKIAPEIAKGSPVISFPEVYRLKKSKRLDVMSEPEDLLALAVF